MRKSRFSDRQIVVVLKQAEAGVPIRDLVRKYGISEQTFYRWRKKYGGLQVSELQQLKQLKEENVRLKGLVADLTLDKQILQEVLSKKSEGREASRDRRLGSGNVPAVSARRLLAAPASALELLLPESERSSNSPSDASAGARRFAATIWLPPSAHSAAA